MKPSTALAAATGLAAVVSARAIPAADTKHAISVRTNISAASPPALSRRSRSVDLRPLSDGTLSTGTRQQNIDAISVSMTPPSAPDAKRKARSASTTSTKSTRSRSASVSSASSANANKFQHLVPRVIVHSNSDGRYLPDNSTCPETGIWDTRWHRCRTEQDEIKEREDAANKTELERRVMIGVPTVLGGVAVLGIAGRCVYRIKRGY